MTIAPDLKLRVDGFDQFLAERMPVLFEFAKSLELSVPHLILSEPLSVLGKVDSWLSAQDVSQEDRAWAISRIGYYIGELLVTHHSGAWLVCEAPNSRYYSRYVVGEFAGFKNSAALVDPFEAATDCIDQPPGRSLKRLVSDITATLAAA